MPKPNMKETPQYDNPDEPRPEVGNFDTLMGKFDAILESVKNLKDAMPDSELLSTISKEVQAVKDNVSCVSGFSTDLKDIRGTVQTVSKIQSIINQVRESIESKLYYSEKSNNLEGLYFLLVAISSDCDTIIKNQEEINKNILSKVEGITKPLSAVSKQLEKEAKALVDKADSVTVNVKNTSSSAAKILSEAADEINQSVADLTNSSKALNNSSEVLTDTSNALISSADKLSSEVDGLKDKIHNYMNGLAKNSDVKLIVKSLSAAMLLLLSGVFFVVAFYMHSWSELVIVSIVLLFASIIICAILIYACSSLKVAVGIETSLGLITLLFSIVALLA